MSDKKPAVQPHVLERITWRRQNMRLERSFRDGAALEKKMTVSAASLKN